MGDRRCEVEMMDGTIRSMTIQSNLTAQELFDLVASQYSLQEKSFFGLAYKDLESPGLDSWLDLKHKVTEQINKRDQTPKLMFGIRIYTSDFASLKPSTRKLFFQQCMKDVSSGKLACDAEAAFAMAALALQAIEGDYLSASATRHHLDRLKLIPDEVLVAKGSSLEACAREVSTEYKSLSGMQQDNAVMAFLTIAEGLPLYGTHLYDVKDKAGVPWIVGMSPSGLSEFYYSSSSAPRKNRLWNSIVILPVKGSKGRFSYWEVDQASSAPSTPLSPKSPTKRKVMKKEGDPSVQVWHTVSPRYAKAMFQLAIDLQTRYQPGVSRTKTRKLSVSQTQAAKFEVCPAPAWHVLYWPTHLCVYVLVCHGAVCMFNPYVFLIGFDFDFIFVWSGLGTG
eukprot:m.225484 g.225484  ORF g.225484 m.225484 type:complete len:394 (-) comp15159_c0_seq4:1388-2569(-)